MSEYVVGGLSGFLESWYGPPERPAEVRKIPGVPAPLCAWYAAEEAWARSLAIQNAIPRSSELVVEDSLNLFYVENQGVWHWAYGSGDDPDVFDRENEPGVPWSPTGASLSEFLVHAAIFEATFASPLGATAIDIDQAHYESVVGGLRPVSMTPWTWPGPDSRLYISDRLLAFGSVNGRPGTPTTPESLYEVFVAAKSNNDLAYLDELDITWQYNSRKFGEGVYR
jgi:hypothetical protein